MRHSLEAWTGLGKEGGEPPGMAALQPGWGGGSAQVPPGTSSQVMGPNTPRSLPGLTGRGGTERHRNANETRPSAQGLRRGQRGLPATLRGRRGPAGARGARSGAERRRARYLSMARTA